MPKRAKANGAKEIDAASAKLRARASDAAAEGIDRLLNLQRHAEPEAVRLAAVKELLDRSFGRAASGDQAGGVIAHLVVDDGYAN